ncbi:MAG TPA: FHA domain-containing protein [Planctomycetota bacterium]|nr:FHA domain-containing protein [Planctomycetota bacterium]
MAKLVFKSGPYSGKSVALPLGKSLTMGRNRDLELPLPDMKLSRRHCQILYSGEKCILKDLGSTNGTFVNGTRLTDEVELNDFDRIVLGDTEIEFHYAEKVPLPHNFDPAGADPFGLDDDPLTGAAVPASGTGLPPTKAVPPIVRQHAAVQMEQPNVQFDSGPALIIDTNLDHLNSEQALEPELVSAAVAADPLAEALHEMMMPLPPEPPPLNLPEIPTTPTGKAKLVFCEGCEGSIPLLEIDLALAKEVNGKMYCKECLAAGKHAAAAAAVAQAPAPVAVRGEPPTVRVVRPPAPPKENVDAMLAGLEQEAVVVDTTLKRGSTVLDEDQAAQKLNQLRKVQEQHVPRHNAPVQPHTPAAPAKPVQSPRPQTRDVKEELGEEFEEIG